MQYVLTVECIEREEKRVWDSIDLGNENSLMWSEARLLLLKELKEVLTSPVHALD